MIDLEARLAELADALDLGGTDMTENVLGRLDEPEPRRRRPWMLGAAATVAIAGAAIVVPDTRSTLARWFELDGLRIERRPDVGPSPAPDGGDVFELPGPGESRVVVVDGREVQVSTIPGRMRDALIRKVIGNGTSVVEVDVAGNRGLWISGAPHEVMYETLGGDVAVERVAGNTLVWQDGRVLHRVEGFGDLESALVFAESGT
jgi:hypothetical protein